MTKQIEFHLEVEIQGDLCQFFLTSEAGLYLKEKIPFDTNIIELYDIWKKAYLKYYKNVRGSISSGSIPEPKDYRFELVMAEAKFLDQFHLWLRAPKLYEQRVKIANSTKLLRQSNKDWVEVFLTCKSKILARLPWETWEIGTDLDAVAQIRITRNAEQLIQQPIKPIHRRARVLAIIGDDSGIELSEDIQIIKSSFSKSITVEVCQYQPNYDEEYFPNKICKILENPKGWDILIFSGHSDETDLLGGQLGIGPNLFIGLNEIIESLNIAKNNGLKFAFFNSCNGLDLANILIEIGISQVAIMREPIHNKTACIFLKLFLENFANFKNVHESLQIACKKFASQKYKVKYPSISLIPSLFRHPKSDIYQIFPNIFYKIGELKPTKKETRFLLFMLIIKIFSAINIPILNTDLETILIESRLLVQKKFDNSIIDPPKKNITIVEIDKFSLDKALNKDYSIHIKNKGSTSEKYEFNSYKYLYELIKKISEDRPKVIGIDYFLMNKNDEYFKKLYKNIQTNTDIKFVFIDTKKQEIKNIARDIDTLDKGNADFNKWYLKYPKKDENLPFSYKLATKFYNNTNIDKNININKKYFNKFFLNWKPIIDFSIPRRDIFDQIPSCKIISHCIKNTEQNLPDLIKDKIIIIGHRSYPGTGIKKKFDDTYKGLIIRNIFQKEGYLEEMLTGPQVHAYMTDHLLKSHFLVSIPYFLMVLITSALGKIISVYSSNNIKNSNFYIINGLGILLYIIFSLLFTSELTIIIPITLPMVSYIYFVQKNMPR